jgi:hypothetical protein
MMQGFRMDDKAVIKRAIMVIIGLAIGCHLLTAPAAAQSLSDRFKSLFGGKSDEPAANSPAESTEETDLTCPPVTVRSGASTMSIAAPGKQAVGNDLRYQAVISKMARECTINAGQITAKIGIQGRVISGPAGAPPSVTVPMRVAVIQGGVGEKVIATKAYQTTVDMAEGASVPFVIVVNDLIYPAPPGALGDSYVFYVGFDPQALKPEPKAKPAKKK